MDRITLIQHNLLHRRNERRTDINDIITRIRERQIIKKKEGVYGLMVGHQITLFFAYSILENNNLTNNTNAHTHIRNRKEEMYIREEVKKKEGG